MGAADEGKDHADTHFQKGRYAEYFHVWYFEGLRLPQGRGYPQLGTSLNVKKKN